jgi:Patatin-like phospholipase
MSLPPDALALAVPQLSYIALIIAAALLVVVLLLLLFARSWLLKNLAYAYLLRFPLLNAAAMLLLVVAAAWTGARTLLGNLFDVPKPFGILLLSLAAFLNAWTVMLTWRLTVRHGVARFNLRSFVREPYHVGPRVRERQVIEYGILAVPLVIYAVVYTLGHNEGEVSAVRVIAEAILGLAAAILLLWGIGGWLSRRTARAEAAEGEGLAERVARLFANVSEEVGRGYFAYEDGEPVRLLPGHGYATAMLGLSLVFYFVVGLSKLARLGAEPVFPTLGYVMLLLMLSCWGLSGAAFFLDRFRVPVVVPLLALFLLTALPPWSDHYYALTESRAEPTAVAAVTCPPPQPSPQPCAQPSPQPSPQASPQPSPQASPAQVPGRPIIVVAANGGGIQAGAWAAVVLAELQRAFKDDFGRSVRVVSSVSGGSVGAMYFVNGYEGGNPPAGEKLDLIIRQAEASSLDEVAWGLAFPDLIRAVTSFGGKWDRGSALEYAFLHEDGAAKKAAEEGGRGGINVPLSAWAGEVATGGRPGSIFNATVSDTGQRIPLSTLALPPCSAGEKTRGRLYNGLGGRDIAVVTAARLSATFPYVSPAARADVGSWTGEQPHLVDGGYYDNYGITSLVEWLDYELSKPGSDIGRVLFIEIRGSPTVDPEADVARQKDEEERAGYDFATQRGWLYQFFAPLGTLLHVRDSGQLSNNRVQLRLLIDKWRGNSGGRAVPITDVVFECNLSGTPTSWHLNRQDKERIKSAWAAVSNNPTEQKSLTNMSEGGLDIVGKFIKGCP